MPPSMLGGRHLDDGAAHHHAARAAGAAGRRAGRLPAGDDLFGSPAILALPAGFHTITTKIWSLFQFPPKPELAAAAALPLLVLTVLLLRAQALILGRRGYAVLGGKYGAPRLIRLGWMALAGLALCLVRAVACRCSCPIGALLNTAFSHIASHVAHARQLHPAQRGLHLLGVVARPCRR